MKILTIATCQFNISSDIKKNCKTILQQIRIAGKKKSDLVHFPECSLSGYAGVNFRDLKDQDEFVLHEALSEVKKAAQKSRVWVIIGCHHFEKDQKKPYNSLYLIDNQGTIQERYDKRLLTGLYGEEDVIHYEPGSKPVIFNIKGIPCGLLICHEWRYPELYREYHKLGTHIIFQSWYDAGVEKKAYKVSGESHGSLITGTVRGNAANNYLWISASNASNGESAFGSFVVQPDGVILKKLGRNQPGVLISKIEPDKIFDDPSSHLRDQVMNRTIQTKRR